MLMTAAPLSVLNWGAGGQGIAPPQSSAALDDPFQGTADPHGGLQTLPSVTLESLTCPEGEQHVPEEGEDPVALHIAWLTKGLLELLLDILLAIEEIDLGLLEERRGHARNRPPWRGHRVGPEQAWNKACSARVGGTFQILWTNFSLPSCPCFRCTAASEDSGFHRSSKPGN